MKPWPLFGFFFLSFSFVACTTQLTCKLAHNGKDCCLSDSILWISGNRNLKQFHPEENVQISSEMLTTTKRPTRTEKVVKSKCKPRVCVVCKSCLFYLHCRRKDQSSFSRLRCSTRCIHPDSIDIVPLLVCVHTHSNIPENCLH